MAKKTKADAYIFLLEFARGNVVQLFSLNNMCPGQFQEDLDNWQACVDLLEEEEEFHLKLLEGRG